jgi:hypothetical protein
MTVHGTSSTTEVDGKRLMQETWLKPNRRAILFGCLPPLILTVVGACLAFAHSESGNRVLHSVGYFLLIVGPAVMGLLLIQLRHPRIAFRNGKVLFYVRGGQPIAVPVNIVESFFFGQGPAHLPAMTKQPNTVNLIARLSQRHTEWARQQVRPALGNWCDGYVTIRGTWCEPLNSDLIRRINRRLKEVKDECEDTSSP